MLRAARTAPSRGNRIFDLMSGMWLKAIGYGREEIARAVFEAMKKITFNPWGMTSEYTIRLSVKLASLAPDKQSRVFLVSGGSEANETALKMAQKYHAIRKEPGRYKVVSRRGSYHGNTHATMALGGGGVAIPWDYGPLQPGNFHSPQPFKFRCAFCKGRNECSLECADEVERAIIAEGPHTVAAFTDCFAQSSSSATSARMSAFRKKPRCERSSTQSCLSAAS
jgi:adenosylmethionine-8-amino-7-oxononanoate aminotransferase